MICKKFIFLLAIIAMCPPCFAQDQEGPEGFQLVIGPRVGVGWMINTTEHFTSRVQALYHAGDYFPVLLLFGITVEQRILLGKTKSHFAFQEIVLLRGLEQGIALPEGAILIGYRDFSGLEFGIGPILDLSGFGVVAALGWTFSFRGVYVPVDVSFTLPNRDRPAVVSLTTGFNFQRRSR